MNSGPIVSELPAAGLPEGAYLLDVREDDEWVAGHAPDAVHIPLGELGGRAEQVPRDQEVYVICRSGSRSAYAAQALVLQPQPETWGGVAARSWRLRGSGWGHAGCRG